MRISDWSSDVCSSDLIVLEVFKFNRPSDFVFSAAVDEFRVRPTFIQAPTKRIDSIGYTLPEMLLDIFDRYAAVFVGVVQYRCDALLFCLASEHDAKRSEEHTSELQSLMRISYAVFCLKK